MGTDPVVAVVNNERMGLSDLVRTMGVADRLHFFERFARRRLIVQLARREGLRVSPEDVQRGVDEWRYQNRLECVEDTGAWLAQRGIGLSDVAAEIEDRLLEDRLIEKVTEGQIEPWFARHTLDFEEADICWIYTADRGAAEEIRVQAVEEKAGFHRMARQYSQDAATRPSGGYLGRLRRCHLPGGIAPPVFAAKPGEVVGPMSVERGYALYLMQQHYPAKPTRAVVREIQRKLFKIWLKREMRRAHIAFPVLESLKGDRAATVSLQPARLFRP